MNAYNIVKIVITNKFIGEGEERL